MQPSTAPFARFLDSVARAGNESQKRHAFTILVATGFDDHEIATDLALGSEYSVRFRHAGLIRRGAIDAYFGNLILEFENDLEATRDHALDQLRGYVAGAWAEDGSTDRAYLAIATDGLSWEAYSPHHDGPEVAADTVLLTLAERWTASGRDDAALLQDFLNRLLYRRLLLAPTADQFARDFGRRPDLNQEGPAYTAAMRVLRHKYDELRGHSQLRVLQRAWMRSLELAYGSIESDDELFIRHTYLANLARLLVWTALERRAPSRNDLDDVFNGTYFQGKQITNLVEDDFFRWPAIVGPTDPASAWQALGRHLATYDLTNVSEDVLKPLYEQLVDPASRHDLGEYYTPDWLAHVVTHRLLEGWNWSDGLPRMLDPTCGSGTFLRACIVEARSHLDENPADTLRQILGSVVGIDVHPLAVVIARATYVLGIKDLIPYSADSVTIPVYLANSLLLAEAEWTMSLFDQSFPLAISDVTYEVPLDFVRDGTQYDSTIEDVMAVAKAFAQAAQPGHDVSTEDIRSALTQRVADRLSELPSLGYLMEVLVRMTHQIASLIGVREDSIHGYLLRNHYRPAMLRQAFDFVVGNPPWLTINDISAPSYKAMVSNEADRYKIASHAAGERGHTELATIFLAHVVAVFLAHRDASTGARVGFVMPRSIFSGTQHRLLRQRAYTVTMDVAELWDLEGISPLFGVPACVVFMAASAPAGSERISGLEWRGRMPAKDIGWDAAQAHASTTPVAYELVYLGKRSAWKRTEGETGDWLGQSGHRAQPYASLFRQGAILYPQTLMIVRTDGNPSTARKAILVRTDPDAAATAKRATKPVNHLVNSASLYRTAAAEHIVPFTIRQPLWLAVLPTLGRPGSGEFRSVDAASLRRHGMIETATWLTFAEAEWARVRKPGDSSKLHERLNHLRHLEEQANMDRYVVLYTSAGSRPVAAVLDTHSLDHAFVARDMTYWASFDRAEEAHYLACLLNSDYALSRIRDWMTRGLFGPRHIHKRVLDVPWPTFDGALPDHRRLAYLGALLAETAQNVVATITSDGGRVTRQAVREQLPVMETREMEMLVAQISSEVVPFYRK